MRRTKIVCTIGPASAAPETLERLIRAGMDVARLNFSHGDHEGHGRVLRSVRDIAARLGRPVAVLQDLAGPKIRIGPILNGPVYLESGKIFVLTSEPVPGDVERVSITYPDLAREVRPGDTLLLSDGALELEVQQATATAITCRVVGGGPLSSHKGINLPTRSIRAPILSAKDRDDLLFGLTNDVDYVALSFVRSAADVAEVRAFMREHGRDDVPLIAKIEKHEALDHMAEIAAAVDGIMVARGDLGVEIPLERVPRVQKTLIELANRAGKPVITATQMLRSMVDNPRPTRAEVADVANAILDGTDAVMLSEESAVGRYPVEAVAMMSRIAEETETDFPYEVWTRRLGAHPPTSPSEGVAHAACALAENLGAAAVVCCTTSGSTARQVAKYRPRPLLLAPTPLESTYRRLALVWGTVPLHILAAEDSDAMIRRACEAALASGLVKKGQTAVITAGVPLNVPGMTNFIRTVVLGEALTIPPV